MKVKYGDEIDLALVAIVAEMFDLQSDVAMAALEKAKASPRRDASASHLRLVIDNAGGAR